jgi:hypothetical protein
MYDTRIGDPVERFFSYCIEREKIRIRREVLGLPRPWTEDPVLQKFRFCNVYREDDRTTRWFRQYVRDPLRDKEEVLLATVLFRWFNRITTGEAMFLHQGLYLSNQHSAWDEYLICGKTNVLYHAIRQFCGVGPYVTGSYIVNSPNGTDKLAGLLQYVDKFVKSGWRQLAGRMIAEASLEAAWAALMPHDGFGHFTAYEVVTDLRWTYLLDHATDIYTWANAGPGAIRGLNRIHDRPLRQGAPRGQSCDEMRNLLNVSRYRWPTEILGVQMHPWEMREVEHSLCEYDKLERARLGQGRPRGVLR